MTDQPISAPRITTGTARRGGTDSRSARAGSPRTAWSRHLDQPGLFERLVAFFAVLLVSLQPSGAALALPLVLAVFRPRVPFLASAGGGALAGLLLLMPGAGIVDNQPGVSTLGLVVAGVLGVAALAAAFARAVENPAERLHHWWVPVAVLGGACLVAWFFVVLSTLDRGGGTLARYFLQTGVRSTPGLMIWPVAIAATLAFLPRRAARFSVPIIVGLLVLALWMATAGFKVWLRPGDDLVIRGRTQPLVESVVPRLVFAREHTIEARFRPSVVRLAPDGRSHALGAIITARRGSVFEWRIFPAGGPQPFITQACDIAFLAADRVLALLPVVGPDGHTGFELAEASASVLKRTIIDLPLLDRPQLSFDSGAGRWAVHGIHPPLTGRFRGPTNDGFTLDMAAGAVLIRVTPQTVFGGAESLEDLSRGDRVHVVEAGPGQGGVAARVLRVDGGSPIPPNPKSVLVRISGSIGSPGTQTTRWTVEAQGPVTWTALNDDYALAQLSIPGEGDPLDFEDPTEWANEGTNRPEFELQAVSRRGATTIATFGVAVVCEAEGLDSGTAVCSASNDRTVFIWRARVDDQEGASLDPVLSFTAPFVSPSVVTSEVAVLNGLQIGMVVVDQKAARAGHLVFPENAQPFSMISAGPRIVAAMTSANGKNGIVVYEIPEAF